MIDLDNSSPMGRESPLLAEIESASPVAQFETLYELVGKATGLHAELANQGAAIPEEALPYIRRFFELTEAIARKPT